MSAPLFPGHRSNHTCRPRGSYVVETEVGAKAELAYGLATAIGDFQAALRRLGIASAVRYPAGSTLIEVMVDGR